MPSGQTNRKPSRWVSGCHSRLSQEGRQRAGSEPPVTIAYAAPTALSGSGVGGYKRVPICRPLPRANRSSVRVLRVEGEKGKVAGLPLPRYPVANTRPQPFPQVGSFCRAWSRAQHPLALRKRDLLRVHKAVPSSRFGTQAARRPRLRTSAQSHPSTLLGACGAFSTRIPTPQTSAGGHQHNSTPSRNFLEAWGLGTEAPSCARTQWRPGCRRQDYRGMGEGKGGGVAVHLESIYSEAGFPCGWVWAGWRARSFQPCRSPQTVEAETGPHRGPPSPGKGFSTLW